MLRPFARLKRWLKPPAKPRRDRRLRVEPLEDRITPTGFVSGTFGFGLALGSSGLDSAYDVATDSSGNAFVAGYFSGTVDFDPSATTINRTSAGGSDIFLAKFTSAGALVWVDTFGSTGTDEARSVAVDSSGNVYMTGRFAGSSDFDPGTGVTTLTSQGSSDIFVAKYASTGSLAWAKGMGGAGTGTDVGQGIAVDAAGNVFTTGSFSGSGDFDPGTSTLTLTASGTADAFLSKLNSSGALQWAFPLGGPSATAGDTGNGIAVDAAGNVVVTGQFNGAVDFDPSTTGSTSLASFGNSDAFVAKYTTVGAFS